MTGLKISFAGAGKVAGALINTMHKAGFVIEQVVSRNETNGKPVADLCNAFWTSELKFPDTSRVIIVSVPDNSLKAVLSDIQCNEETLVVHTAGSFGLDVFPHSIKHKAVFYPLQTFSREREVDFKGLPFFLETGENGDNDIVKQLAEQIGGKAYFTDASQRRNVHLAAVFINNFTNHMLTTGKSISERAGLPYDIFEPLIKETFSKALEQGPENSQTGPAIRNDFNTIEKHLNLLSFSPESQNIYREVTDSIMNYYKNKIK